MFPSVGSVDWICSNLLRFQQKAPSQAEPWSESSESIFPATPAIFGFIQGDHLPTTHSTQKIRRQIVILLMKAMRLTTWNVYIYI